MILFLLIMGLVLVFVDQIIKYWAVNVLMPVGSMDFIKIFGVDVLGFYYTQNDGAAFSSFSGAKYFLIIMNVILMVGLIAFAVYYNKKNNAKSKPSIKILNTAIMLIIAGGIGNIIDRIRLSYVIDYLEVRLFRFAIFNFADICVVIGAFLLAFYTIISDIKTKNSEVRQ